MYMKNTLYITFYILFLTFFTTLQLQAQNEDEIRQFLIDKINKYRVSLNLPEVQRWEEGEVCADQSTLNDFNSNIAHEKGICEESAHIICPMYKTMDLIKSYCIESIETEGPPPSLCTEACYRKHERYVILTNPSYTKVAIGIYKMPNGRYMVSMNFK